MKEFREAIQKKFDLMQSSGKLFRVVLTGQEIWDLYLKSMGSSIFRDPNSSEWNCKLCSNWVRRYSNIVSINSNYEIETMFDVELPSESQYYNTVKILATAIKNSKIVNVFFETYQELNSLNYEKCSKTANVFQLGIPSNVKRYTTEEVQKFGVVNTHDIYTFNHFALKVNKEFVDQSGKSVEAIMGDYRSAYDVFRRGMETISLDTLELVRDLINQGSLLDGTTHLFKVEAMIQLKKEYNDLAKTQRDNWFWDKSYKFQLAKFRNELIGTLCVELTEGEELNKAITTWNKRVDPANYMKAIAPITKFQIAEAQKFVVENGYEESFNRRCATLDDIKISEILHSNVGDGTIKKVSIFDNVKATSTQHKRSEFDGVETVGIEKFMKDILPTCTSVEAFLTNNQEGNLVTLTTSAENSKPIFKWDNPFSWTFNGNLAGKSMIKEEVKSKGGKVDGVLRFSMMWADGNGDNSDLDLHCIEPTNFKIYFGKKVSPYTGGNLDIDITQPGGKLAVENITYPSINRMQDGIYKLFVHQFANRNSKGFKAEIEFDGELYSYTYDKSVNGNVQVAEVTLKNGKFTIKHILPATDGIGVSKELYGLETNKFHKVNLVCLTPNHWGTNNVGNKHYLFMLEGCKSPTSIRGFHNENLLSELAQYRKVLEVLGTVQMVESTDKQLSGLGYNSTVREELILRLSGSHKRVIKVKF